MQNVYLIYKKKIDGKMFIFRSTSVGLGALAAYTGGRPIFCEA